MITAVARLTTVGTVACGTAFAVAPELALTAFHCIGNRHRGAVAHSRVHLRFVDGWHVAATVLETESDHQADFAVLHLDARLPEGLSPLPLTRGSASQVPWRSVGYPQGVTDPRVPGPDLFTIDGTITEFAMTIFGGTPAIQLYCHQAAASVGLSLHGMSGAPILVGQPAAAIGLVRWNPHRPDAPDLAVGGTLFACPMRSVLSRQPRLGAKVLNEKHQPSTLRTESYDRIRTVLLQCSEFESDAALRAVFVTRGLQIYRDRLPQTNRIVDRVDQTLAALIGRLQDGEPVLSTFLDVLSDRYEPSHDIRRDLKHLAGVTREEIVE